MSTVKEILNQCILIALIIIIKLKLGTFCIMGEQV